VTDQTVNLALQGTVIHRYVPAYTYYRHPGNACLLLVQELAFLRQEHLLIHQSARELLTLQTNPQLLAFVGSKRSDKSQNHLSPVHWMSVF
jgi:hypothetical protein